MIYIPLRYRGIKLNFRDWRPGKEHKKKASVEVKGNQAIFPGMMIFIQSF